MKYEIGDEIIVLHSNEAGKVVEIMNDKMVMINVRGVKFPAYMDQIDFPYFHRFTQKPLQRPETKPKVYVENIPKEKPKPTQLKVSEGVWLLMMPKFSFDEYNDEVVDLLKVYLVNKSDLGLSFQYDQYFLTENSFSLQSEIGPFQDFYLHDLLFERINDTPTYHFSFSLLTPQKQKALKHEVPLKIKGKQFFQKIEEAKQKNLPTISFKLFDDYPDKAVAPVKFELPPIAEKKFQAYSANEARKHLPPARSVIDLHIEKLTNDWEKMSNAEILNTQLNEFHKWFDLAIAHHQHSLIVIHGIGKGVLKDEIHDELKLKRNVKTFINQYHPKYGYGATEIYFDY